MAMTMDVSKFKAGLKKVMKGGATIGAKAGVRNALIQLKLDADNIEPRTPHLEGNLRGDYILEVKADPVARMVYGTLVYNMPYAAKLHEAEGNINWSEPGSGAKYVENKIGRFKNKYNALMGIGVQKGMQSGAA